MSVTISDVSNLLEPFGSGYRKWTTNALTYSFVSNGAAPSYYTSSMLTDGVWGFGANTLATTARALGANQQDAAEAALSAWSAVANISFTKLSSGVGDISIGQMPFTSGSAVYAKSAAALGYFPLQFSGDDRNGDVWINDNLTSNNDTFFAGENSSGRWLLLHELGHALGLSHPFEQNPKDSRLANSWRYSVMSYKDLNGNMYADQGMTSGAPTAPMLLDIAAIQRLYGANPNTNTADNTYQFESLHDWPIQAIWDAGGNDTIDGSSQSRNLRIDLRAGGESYVVGRNDQRVNGQPEIHIAFQPLLADGTPDSAYDSNFIENAVGGDGDDRIIGNVVANNLNGGEGEDTIEGGEGNDVLVGGEDDDRLNGGLGSDTYVYFTGDGKDVIVDQDGIGLIQINGVTLTGALVGTPYPDADNGYRRTWEGEINGQRIRVIEWEGSIQVGATLRIEGEAIGSGQITVENFTNNQLGLDLQLTPQAFLLSDAVVNPFANGIPGTSGPLSVEEGHAGTLTLASNTPAVAGQTVQFNGDPSATAGLSIVNGAESIPFVNGSLTIQLAEGQSVFVFTLVSREDVDADANFNLIAQLLDAQGQAQGAAASLQVTIEAVDEQTPEAPETFPNSYTATESNDDLTNDGISTAGAAAFVEALGGDDILHYSQTWSVPAYVIDAGSGSDHVTAEAASVWVSAGDGNDLVYSYGDVTVEGGAGSDFLMVGVNSAATASARLYSESEISVDQAISLSEDVGEEIRGDLLSSADPDSNDVLIGSNRRDILAGGGGEDQLIGGAGGDLILADRTIWTNYTDNEVLRLWTTLTWGWSVETTTSNGQTTYGYELTSHIDYPPELVNPPPSDDVLSDQGSAGAADVIYAGAGNDYVAAGAGDDFIDAGSGDDIVFGEVGNETILGGAGNDIIDGGDADDTNGAEFLDGGDGDDRVWGANGTDVLYGGAGNDELYGDDNSSGELAGADYLNGEDGNDYLAGGARADTLLGGDGNDTLYGDGSAVAPELTGNDFLDGGAGNDQLVGGGGADTLLGRSGDDQLYGDSNDPNQSHGDDYLDGAEGNDYLAGGGGADWLYGGAGNDQLIGDGTGLPGEIHGDDYLDGGEGDDVIYGGSGNDVLRGGLGVDVLRGDAGDDTYIFGAADLTIENAIADGIIDTEGNNEVVFTDLSLEDFQLLQGSQTGSINLVANNGATGLVIRDGLSNAISTFTFAGGEQLSAATLIGSHFDANADQTSETDGATLYGGTDSDTIEALGDDSTISGGRGDDLLVGGDGNTTYLFNRGDGNDTITDQSTFLESGNRNVLALGGDIVLGDIEIRATIGATSATLDLGSGDSITVNSFSLTDPVNGSRTLDEITIGEDAITWDALLAARGTVLTNLNGVASYAGTAYDDQITGATIDETINGGAGDDVIDGAAGNDLLSGGTGSDTYVLRQGSGADTINNFDTQGGKTDRLLIDSSIATADVEFIRIGESLLVRVRNTGEQVFVSDYFGTAGLDEIEMPDGTVYTTADVPWQLGADNVLTYERGQGEETFAISDPLGMALDVLHFGSNVDAASVVLQTNENGDLVVRFRDEQSGQLDYDDRITLVGSLEDITRRLDGITFAGNPELRWSAEDILYRATLPTNDDNVMLGSDDTEVLHGLGGLDTLYGNGGNDELYGDDASDTLYGGDGNDLLVGGADADTLIGGAGNDTFLIGSNGRDLITGFDNSSSNDSLVFAAGIRADSVVLERFWDDLLIHYVDPVSNATQIVEIDDYFAPAHAGQTIDQIRFTDDPAVVWDATQVRARLYVGSPVAETLTGDDENNTMQGLGGNDELRGGLGQDDLDGGAGSDTLFGQEGDDTYRFGFGAGRDTITDGTGANRIVMGTGVLPANITVIRTMTDSAGGWELVLVLDSQNQLTISSYSLNSTGTTVEFSDGTIWTSTDIASRITDLTGTQNTQQGTASNDTYSVDNVLDGIVESSGGGVDSVNATASYELPTNVENLYLQSAPYDIHGSGNSADNTIVGNSGNNNINGRGGADTLIGGAGDDTYSVGSSSELSFVDDTVIENTNEGFDTLIVSSAYGATLPNNVESIVYRPGSSWYASAPAGVYGNALDNILRVEWTSIFSPSQSQGVLLDGGAGADIMYGSAMAEIYVVDNAADVVVETGSNLIDSVRSSVSYVLPSLVEDLQLTGSAAISGTGNAGANIIDGSTNSAANVLTGGTGDDRYILGAGDSLIENAGEGSDTVVLGSTSLSALLSDYANVENMELSTTQAVLVATGNDGDNRIVGNASNNTLSGGGGSDSIFDSATETLEYDVLDGGDGADTLTSRGGADRMVGGAGDDVLIARQNSGSGARVEVGMNSDYDTVQNDRAGALLIFDASVLPSDVRVARDQDAVYVYVGTTTRVLINYDSAWTTESTLAGFEFSNGTVWNEAQIEAAIQSDTGLPSSQNDALVGTAVRDRIDGLAGNDSINGNGGDDRLQGGAGNDTLDGGSGADTLEGGIGDDVLSGGAGADTYVFSAGFGFDVIRDTQSGQTQDAEIDSVVFDSTITREEVLFERSVSNPDDLFVTRRATGDRLVIERFYAEPAAGDQIEQFVFADGSIVTADSLRGVPIVNGTTGADNLTAGAASTLYGYAGDDTLTGSSGADTLDGGLGADTMAGGAGNDLYRVDDAADVVTELSGGGEDAIESSVSYELTDHVEGLQLGGNAANATGNAAANRLVGNDAANLLDGRGGADTMIGGEGSDVYIVDDVGDVVQESLAAGYDTIRSSVSYGLGNDVEALTLEGSGNLDATGNSQANFLGGNAGNNRLDGGQGADTLVGGAGNDTYVVDDVGDIVVENEAAGTDAIETTLTYRAPENVETIRLLGTSAIDGYGNSAANTLIGNSAANTLDGDAGADEMQGGAGDDTYVVDSAADVVVESAGEGDDLVISTIDTQLSANLERLRLAGNAANGSGNALDNRIEGNSLANTLDGGAGVDTLLGGAGDDTYLVDNSGDTVTELAGSGNDTVRSSATYTLGAQIETLILEGSGAISGTGNTLANLLVGNTADNILNGGDGNDTLDGGTGTDTLIGGNGDDTYLVESSSDSITEASSAGVDLVRSTASYTLSANVENLELLGTGDLNGTGSAVVNRIVGTAGNNILDGGSAADTLIGGTGNDTYVVDHTSEVVTELADEGIDTVQTSVTHTLAANVEHIVLTGSANIGATGNALNNQMTGNGGANSLAGGDGNDIIDGGAGNDTMTGGAGDDTYVVGQTADTIVEAAGGGIDSVNASATFTLSNEVENLMLVGSANINGTGNGSGNTLTGNSGNNVLDGAGGADTLIGGTGNDTYVVDNAGDVVVELVGEGTDLIQASASYTLAANVENITLGGTATSAAGNELDNVLTGNSVQNTLTGGAGNDTYVVQNVDDLIVEASGEGTDIVQSTITYTLATHVENLTLTGSSTINGTGNDLDNVLIGNGAANILAGGAGNDTLEGGSGVDRTEGGAGNDIHIVNSSSDTVIELAGEGTDTIVTSVTLSSLAANVENLTLTGTSALNATGNELDNVITGNEAANALTGGLGIDTLIGGSGNDTYVVDNVADVVVESVSGGTDLVQATASYTLSGNVENLTLTGSSSINGVGNSLDNVLTGNTGANSLDGGAGNDTLNGGSGADQLTGGSGDDTFVVDNTGDVVIELANEGLDTVQASVTYTLGNHVENLTLTNSGSINATGNAAANTLIGNSGNNTLDGMAGADQLTGGQGNDTYIVDDAGDVVTEIVNGGTDTVQSSISYALTAEVENLTLIGTANIDATGNALANTLTGNSGTNTLTGGAGNDIYVITASDIVVENAGEGTDTIHIGTTFSLIANIENLTLTGTSTANGTGNDLDNVLTGNSAVNVLSGGIGNDTLDGGGGADQLTGGVGDDIYVVDHASDSVSEIAGQGVDTVQASINYTLGAELENLTLIGSGSYTATGNALDNVVTGNGAGNTLNGGAGADTLMGGGGNDTYIVDGADTVIEGVNAGTDTVQSALSYSLSSNVENLSLTGSANINGTGNELANVLTGNTGANVLTGGLGDDTYVVADALDSLVEQAGEGTDLVQSSVSYTLTGNIENLTLTGTAANGTGNDLANVLTGNSAANTLTGADGDDTLNGGSGADMLVGGTGNDTYVVDNAGDVITEAAGEGVDTVQSSLSYTLGTHLEHLTFTGSASATGTGNDLDNILTGNNGANTLIGGAGQDVMNGGSGADAMTGGVGDDQYFVDNASDTTVEATGEGIDSVTASLAHTLAANVELLFLSGSSSLAGTGNSLANLLRGNTGANTLTGGGGNDILEGGGGNDTLAASSSNSLLNGGAATDTLTASAGNDLLIGGLGNDTLTTGDGADIIALNRGDGQDTVAVSTTLDNTISIGGGAKYADLLFVKSGNDLVLKIGGTDQITLTGYYASASNRSVNTLQVIVESSTDYNPGGGDPLRDNRVETFDFEGLVAAFDAARVANPNLTSWALSDALLAQHLSGSDTAALGGDLAYRYGLTGNLSDISFTPALALVSSGSFGASAQTLQALAALQDSTVRLSA